MNQYLSIFLIFIITYIVESLIALVLIKENPKKILSYIFLINLFTWPLANLVYSYNFNFYLIEIGVIIIESALIMALFKLKYAKSITLSITANIVTALLSFFITF